MSYRSINLITASATLDTGYDTYFIDASSNNVTLTMDNIVGDGENYVIKRLDSSTNTVTIQGYNGSQKIDGSVSITMTHGQSFMIMALNNLWHTTFKN